MISEESLLKFIQLYRDKYGILLGKQEASDMFSQLIGIVKIIISTDSSTDQS